MTDVPAPVPPTLVNTTATAIDVFLTELEAAMAPAIKAATLAAIDAAVPELAGPIIDTIVSAAVGAAESAVENFVTKTVELGATYIVIDFQTAEENSDIVAARKAYISAVASGNQAAIAAARINYANAQSALTRDDGSATPQ